MCVWLLCVCAPLCSMWGRSGFAQILAAFLAYWADFVRIRWTEWRKEWWCRWINVHCFSKWVNVKPSPFERVLHWPCTPPPRIHVMALSELVKARNSVDSEWGAGLFPETSYHCQNMSFNLFSPCPAPFFLWKSRTFFFIISVFSGLCGTLSLNAKMNAVVKESLCFCYSVFGFGQYTGVVAIWMWLLLHLLTKK